MDVILISERYHSAVYLLPSPSTSLLTTNQVEKPARLLAYPSGSTSSKLPSEGCAFFGAFSLVPHRYKSFNQLSFLPFIVWLLI